MIKEIKNSYEHTIYASYVGYLTQAIVNNFVPLLFLTFINDYGLTLDKVTLITTINFLVQLCVDLLSAKLMDKIGYRRAIVTAHIFAVAGLCRLAFLPNLIGSVYTGIMISVVLYAIGGGIIEVLISPIVEACPMEKKEAAMSLLHSFYCWGHLFVIVVSTVFFKVFGIANWKIMACIWAVIPLFNAVYFLLVPIYPITDGHEKLSLKGLASQKVFWLLIVLMVCAGASEQAMSQWASAFAESGLGISKTMGDLLGPCVFSILMGSARLFYGKMSHKINLTVFLFGSSVLCIASYLLVSLSANPVLALAGCGLCGLSVGIMWPSVYSVASASIPKGGAALFALLALSGDLGCSGGPTIVGLVSGAMDGNLKVSLLLGIIFPMLMIAGILLKLVADKRS